MQLHFSSVFHFHFASELEEFEFGSEDHVHVSELHSSPSETAVSAAVVVAQYAAKVASGTIEVVVVIAQIIVIEI